MYYITKANVCQAIQPSHLKSGRFSKSRALFWGILKIDFWKKEGLEGRRGQKPLVERAEVYHLCFLEIAHSKIGLNVDWIRDYRLTCQNVMIRITCNN